MALNAALVGRSYPPTAPYLVGREKVREFATAVGDTNPACFDVAAAQALGYADIVAPPTFAFVVAYAGSSKAALDPELGLDYTRVVHGEQRFVFERPIVAGDALVATARIEAIRAVAGNDIGIAESPRGYHIVVRRIGIADRGRELAHLLATDDIRLRGRITPPHECRIQGQRVSL